MIYKIRSLRKIEQNRFVQLFGVNVLATCSSTGSPSSRKTMTPWKATTFVVIALSVLISSSSGFLATSPPLLARRIDPLFSSEPTVDSEPVVADNKVLASEVKFWTALQQVFKGGLRKRDFFR